MQPLVLSDDEVQQLQALANSRSLDSNGERKGLGAGGGLLAILENNPDLSKEI
jgi:hypothetical protein